MGYKYKVNHGYFEKIDEEYRAYILGFIYADGSVGQPLGNRQLKLTIAIQLEDGYILKKLANEAGGRDVYISHSPSSVIKNWKKKAVLDISSNQIGNSLINYGCKINKSRVGMEFPNLDNHLIPHFIRGFLDGDGSIIIKKINYKYKRKTTRNLKVSHKQRYKLKIAFCSTDKVFLETIAKHLPIKKYYLVSKKRKQIVYILWIENPEDVNNSLNYLYKDATYFLKRKHDKIEEFNKTIKSQAENAFSEGLETT